MIELTEKNRQDLVAWLRAGATGRVLNAIEDLRHVDTSPVTRWCDIATAPKDGSSIIAMYEHNETQIVNSVFWFSDEDGAGWWTYMRSELSRELLNGWRTPTRWMPLPGN